MNRLKSRQAITILVVVALVVLAIVMRLTIFASAPSQAAKTNGHLVVSGLTATDTATRTPASSPTRSSANAIPNGTWQNITPRGVSLDYNNPPANYGTQIIQVDPSNPQVIYVGTCYQGLWKSTNGGTTWFKVNTGTNGSALDGRLWSVALDQVNPQVVWVANGFGFQQGIWKSTDGGVDWQQMEPSNLQSQTSADVYSIVTDPYAANHVLVTFHESWGFGQNPTYGDSAGILESLDGGHSWIIHNPLPDWGSADFVFFLDNSSTWLHATSNGIWRTTDSGHTWSQVSQHPIQHGADQLYRARNGVLYIGGLHQIARSTDNGVTWTEVGPSSQDGYNAVIGDGTCIFIQPANTGGNTTGPQPYYYSLESDGTHWRPYNSQAFSDGPMSMAIDRTTNTIYSSNWDAGVWKLVSTSR